MAAAAAAHTPDYKLEFYKCKLYEYPINQLKDHLIYYGAIEPSINKLDKDQLIALILNPDSRLNRVYFKWGHPYYRSMDTSPFYSMMMNDNSGMLGGGLFDDSMLGDMGVSSPLLSGIAQGFPGGIKNCSNVINMNKVYKDPNVTKAVLDSMKENLESSARTLSSVAKAQSSINKLQEEKARREAYDLFRNKWKHTMDAFMGQEQPQGQFPEALHSPERSEELTQLLGPQANPATSAWMTNPRTGQTEFTGAAGARPAFY